MRCTGRDYKNAMTAQAVKIQESYEWVLMKNFELLSETILVGWTCYAGKLQNLLLTSPRLGHRSSLCRNGERSRRCYGRGILLNAGKYIMNSASVAADS